MDVYPILHPLTRFFERYQLQYYQVLLDFPFKGEESPLRAMERAELISITTKNGVYKFQEPSLSHIIVCRSVVNDSAREANPSLCISAASRR